MIFPKWVIFLLLHTYTLCTGVIGPVVVFHVPVDQVRFQPDGPKGEIVSSNSLKMADR